LASPRKIFSRAGAPESDISNTPKKHIPYSPNRNKLRAHFSVLQANFSGPLGQHTGALAESKVVPCNRPETQLLPAKAGLITFLFKNQFW
jgi:hypothetical protein